MTKCNNWGVPVFDLPTKADENENSVTTLDSKFRMLKNAASMLSQKIRFVVQDSKLQSLDEHTKFITNISLEGEV